MQAHAQASKTEQELQEQIDDSQRDMRRMAIRMRQLETDAENERSRADAMQASLDHYDNLFTTISHQIQAASRPNSAAEPPGSSSLRTAGDALQSVRASIGEPPEQISSYY